MPRGMGWAQRDARVRSLARSPEVLHGTVEEEPETAHATGPDRVVGLGARLALLEGL